MRIIFIDPIKKVEGKTRTSRVSVPDVALGYMMACMSSPGQLYCAPFAMIGSIGVIGQSINVQKTLEKYGIKPYHWEEETGYNNYVNGIVDDK